MFTYKPSNRKVPIKIWMSKDDYYSDQGMVDQCEALASLPFAYRHISLSPDGHLGYGMPIGGILATKGVVIPNCVGSDIGCGVRAVKTNLKSENLTTENIKQIMGYIRKKIPVGFERHKVAKEWSGFRDHPNIEIINKNISSAMCQLGTLGGGNHFIEIQKGSDNFIWFMIHSGSRNFGYKIAKEYNEKAVALCKRWFSDIPNKDLSFLPIESKEAKEYLEAMNYALSFAKANRKDMSDMVKDSFLNVFEGMTFDNDLDIHHNYAAWENHYGQNVIVHRKGATSARKDQLGIIPGSQGTKSYIVKGLGNPESFMSCSHGAGRKMSRTRACNELDLKDEIKKLDEQGIVHGIRHTKDLDEASGAYKNIDIVMKNQKDLVSIEIELIPLGVIKG